MYFKESLHIAEVDPLNRLLRENSFVHIRQNLTDFSVVFFFGDDPYLEIPFLEPVMSTFPSAQERLHERLHEKRKACGRYRKPFIYFSISSWLSGAQGRN